MITMLKNKLRVFKSRRSNRRIIKTKNLYIPTASVDALPIAWWDFDDNILDAIGDYDLSNEAGSYSFSTGIVNNCIVSTDVVLKNTSSELFFNGPKTYVGWFYVGALGQPIFSIGNIFTLAINFSNQLVIFEGPLNSFEHVIGGAAPGVFYFICVRYDGINNFSVRIDNGAFTDITYVITGGDAFRLAGDSTLVSNVDGKMDSVAVYDQEISNDLVDWLYNSGSGRSSADL